MRCAWQTLHPEDGPPREREDQMIEASVVEVLDDSISVDCGVSLWTMSNGLIYLEEDYRVAGEVWRGSGDTQKRPMRDS
jgi:hypothetical protein